MTIIHQAPKFARLTAEALRVAMRSDRPATISTRNYGWNRVLGSGVT
jgi:hypothetical protein